MNNYNWANAYNLCLNFGAELVTIKSQSENDYVASLIPNTSQLRVWIGGSSRSVYGYTNWSNGEPNNLDNEEDKILMYGNYGNFEKGKWNDERRSTELDGIVCTYNKY